MPQATPTVIAAGPPPFGTAVAGNLPLLLRGLAVSVELSVLALILSLVLGVRRDVTS